MVDPTSELNENVSEEEAPTCVVCGEPLVENPTHRVVTWIEGEAVETRHFCDDDCKSEWSR